jgi:hypothetical protein
MAYEIYRFKEPAGGGSLSFGAPEQKYCASLTTDGEPWHIVAIDTDAVDVSAEDGVDNLEPLPVELMGAVRAATIINWGTLDDIDASLDEVGL